MERCFPYPVLGGVPHLVLGPSRGTPLWTDRLTRVKTVPSLVLRTWPVTIDTMKKLLSSEYIRWRERNCSQVNACAEKIRAHLH